MQRILQRQGMAFKLGMKVTKAQPGEAGIAVD
jgi:hypothetical protein